MEDWTKYFKSFRWDRFKRIDQSQNWFQVFRIMPDTLAIWEPWHREMVISYLIIGRQLALLFDTGLGIGDMRKLIKELGYSDIIVINSHSHWDHIGGNFQFDGIYGLKNAYAQKNCKGKSGSQAKQYLTNAVIEDKLPDGFKKDFYAIKPYSVAKYIKNGDFIDLGERKLEILLTPGHSPDSLSLLDSKNQGIFIGDTFYLSSLYAHLPGSDFYDYYDTCAKLSSIAGNFENIFPSHRKTAIPSSYLNKLYAAFKEIRFKSGSIISTEGNKQFQFDEFSIIV